jgi:hypothetical protein
MVPVGRSYIISVEKEIHSRVCPSTLCAANHMTYLQQAEIIMHLVSIHYEAFNP